TCAARVGEAQPCTTSLQCEDGLLCVGAPDGTATCARPLAEGAACVATPSVGEPGCQLDRPCDASGHCRRLPALDGRACADGTECASAFEMGTYYCDGATKVCVRTAAVGEPCVLQQPPMASCQEGVCDAATLRCVLVCE
ncbi:MAG TPA: hypothetical protein VF334_14175, partial [Polyangia bacterium]